MSFNPYWEEKCWGRVQHLFASDRAAVSYLELAEGWRCSIHRHLQRTNFFAVTEGKIVIEEWGPVKDLNRCGFLRLLGPGDTLQVPSLSWHRFRVLQSGKMIEIYWPDSGGVVEVTDIIRLEEGGKDDLNELRNRLVQEGLV